MWLEWLIVGIVIGLVIGTSFGVVIMGLICAGAAAGRREQQSVVDPARASAR